MIHKINEFDLEKILVLQRLATRLDILLATFHTNQKNQLILLGEIKTIAKTLKEHKKTEFRAVYDKLSPDVQKELKKVNLYY